MYVYKKKAEATITIEGTKLAEMEAEARKQFAAAFGDTPWELTDISAHLDMVQVGSSREEWLPGMWRATYEATEL